MVNDPVLTQEWLPAATVSDLDSERPHSVRVLGQDVVLIHLEGRWEAWLDLCIHRGTKLSLGRIEAAENSSLEKRRITCPYHGWAYASGGVCVHIPAHPDQAIPAKARAQTLHATVANGMVWVAFEEPSQPPPTLPEWDDSSYRKIMAGTFTVQASAPRVIENFLDVAHLPLVHDGWLGVKEQPEIPDYEVSLDPDGITAPQIKLYQPNPDGAGVAAWVSYTYKVLRPLTAYFTKNADENRMGLMLTVTPISELESIARFWMALNYGHDLPDSQWRDGQAVIFNHDRPILESQRPELLPLDLQVELHLRSDRLAIAYRKWLGELGLGFGTA